MGIIDLKLIGILYKHFLIALFDAIHLSAALCRRSRDILISFICHRPCLIAICKSQKPAEII